VTAGTGLSLLLPGPVSFAAITAHAISFSTAAHARAPSLRNTANLALRSGTSKRVAYCKRALLHAALTAGVCAGAAVVNAMVVSDLRDYAVRERIGKGSFGEVYLVVHKHSGRQCVLKQVRLARQNEWQRNASHLEMQLAHQLEHPFIVPHVESWVDRGHTIQMVHEYCPRGDTRSMLDAAKVCVAVFAPGVRLTRHETLQLRGTKNPQLSLPSSAVH
jgi:Protein kinase domain